MRDHAAQAGVGVVERVHGSGGGQCCRVGEHRGIGHTEALLDAFHRGADRGGNGAVVLKLEQQHQADADGGDHAHHRDDRVALLLALDHAAECAGQREADDKQEEDLDPVRPGVGVLERVGGVRVVEAAAIGAQFLDGLLAGDRPAGDGLLAADERIDNLIVHREVLDRTTGDQDDRRNDGERQKDADGAADQVHPEVAQLARVPACDAANERHRNGHAYRRRDEVLHGKAGHLYQVALGRFTRIGLPVGVCHEADSRVPCQRRRHRRGRVVEVQRQLALHQLEDEEQQNADRGEGEHAAGVSSPGLFGLRVGSD